MLIPIPYQPVTFIYGDYVGYAVDGDSCNQCYAPPYCQMVQQDDITQFQVEICDFNDEELIDNNTFTTLDYWTVTGGFTIDTNNNQAVNSTGVAGTLSQPQNIMLNNTYLVKFRIKAFNDNASGNSAFVKVGGVIVKTLTAAGDNDGDYILTYFATSITNQLFEVTTEDNVEVQFSTSSMIAAGCQIIQLTSNPTFNTSTFWSFTGSWTFIVNDGSGVSGAAQILGGTGELSIPIDTTTGAYFRLAFSILTTDLSGTDEITIRIGGVDIFTIDENLLAGNYVVYACIENWIEDKLVFDANITGPKTFIIDNIYIHTLSGLGFEVRDENNVSVFAGIGEHASGIAQGTIDWSTIAEGCYKICVYDLSAYRADIIDNGQFIDGQYWNLSGSFTIAAGKASVNSTLTGEMNQDIISPPLVGHAVYELDYLVINWANVGAATVDVLLNDVVIQTLSTAGVNNGNHKQIVVVGDITNAQLRFVVNADGSNLTVDFDDVEIRQLTGCGSQQLISNPRFDFDGKWNKNNFTISGGKASNVLADGFIRQLGLQLKPNQEYTFRIMINTLSNKLLTIYYDGVEIASFTTTGSKTFTFTTGLSITDPTLSIEDSIVIVNGNQTILDDVFIDLFEGCGEEFCSECYSLRTEHPCSSLVEWTNPKNTMGYNYEDLSFTQSLRLEALLRRATFIEDFNLQNTESNGDLKQVAARSRKQQQFAISQAPEYIHEAIEQGARHKIFSIDNVKYRKIGGDYIPNWRDRALVAPALMDVQKESQPNREMTNT